MPERIASQSPTVFASERSPFEKAGYVKVTKGYFGNRPRTRVGTTAKGATAFSRQVTALQEIAQSAGP